MCLLGVWGRNLCCRVSLKLMRSVVATPRATIALLDHMNGQIGIEHVAGLLLSVARWLLWFKFHLVVAIFQQFSDHFCWLLVLKDNLCLEQGISNPVVR